MQCWKAEHGAANLFSKAETSQQEFTPYLTAFLFPVLLFTNLMDVLVPERLTDAVISHIFHVKDPTVNVDLPLNCVLSTNPVAERWKM